MGGSGGGTPDFGRPSGGGGPQPGNGGDLCSSLTEDTLIASPAPAVISTITVGETLRLSLSPGDNPPVLAQKPSGVLVGTVMPTFLVDLVDCMRAGNAYEVKVLEISGGAIRVRVQPETP